MDFRNRSLEVSIQAPPSQLKIIGHGPNHLKVSTHQPPQGGWLYFADTWDNHWEAKVGGIPMPVYKGNLQFKAVYVPGGMQVVELSYNPSSFLKLVVLAYIFQFVSLIIWWKTRTGNSP